MAREAFYQRKVIKHYTKEGWFIVKVIRANMNGLPDLFLFKPDRPPLFIEVKGIEGKLSEVQKYRIKQLQEQGFQVIVADPVWISTHLSA